MPRLLTFQVSMKPGSFLLIFITLLISVSSCSPSLPPANRVFVVQPFTDLSPQQADEMVEKLKGNQSKYDVIKSHRLTCKFDMSSKTRLTGGFDG